MKTVDTFLLQCIVSCTIAISNIFVYCYFGQNVTTKFMQVTDVVYATNWYGFPLVQQKALLLNMMRVQRPFYFTGYYISSCSLSTFQAVRVPSNNIVFNFFIFFSAFRYWIKPFRIAWCFERSNRISTFSTSASLIYTKTYTFNSYIHSHKRFCFMRRWWASMSKLFKWVLEAQRANSEVNYARITRWKIFFCLIFVA